MRPESAARTVPFIQFHGNKGRVCILFPAAVLQYHKLKYVEGDFYADNLSD